MRNLIALVASTAVLVMSSVATAQEFTSGAEVVPTWNNNTGYVWAPPRGADTVHPADTYVPAISPNDNVLYTRDSWVNGVDSRTLEGTSTEAKFRTECAPAFTKRADPLLFPGQYPVGHGHTFFGAASDAVIADVQNFNYTMGRANPKSSCQGGPLNTTLYWEPSIYRNVNGLIVTVIPLSATFYYTHPESARLLTTHLRRNIRFIAGANPMDYNDTKRRAELAAATGTGDGGAAGLEYAGGKDATNGHTPAGLGGVACYAASSPNVAITPLADHAMRSSTGAVSTTNARYIVGPGGVDPWGGGCEAAGHIIVGTSAPTCWDGTNLSSPNGRDHFRHMARDEDNDPLSSCPTNYVKVMRFETKVFVNHNGWTNDLKHWYMSSDRMRMATTECPDATVACDGVSGGNVPATVDGVYYSRVSNDPCRRTGVDFCSFATAHFDWWGAWDWEELKRWQRRCGGLTIDGVAGEIADCNNGATDEARSLQDDGAPPEAGLSTNPINTYDGAKASATTAGQKYFPVRTDDQNQGALSHNVTPDHHN